MKLVIFSAFALAITALPGGHAGDDHAHDAEESGDHGMEETDDVQPAPEGSGENHDMENSEYYDMHDDDHGKGWGAAAPHGYGPMGHYGMNQNKRDGNQGIVINNNVGGGCEMEGIAEKVARKVVEMMMEKYEYKMEMMDDKQEAEIDQDSEETKNEKKDKKDKKKNKKEE